MTSRTTAWLHMGLLPAAANSHKPYSTAVFEKALAATYVLKERGESEHVRGGAREPKHKLILYTPPPPPFLQRGTTAAPYAAAATLPYC